MTRGSHATTVCCLFGKVGLDVRISTLVKLAAIVAVVVIAIQIGRNIADHMRPACGLSGTGVAHADTSGCLDLHNAAVDPAWAAQQQQRLTGSTLTTGLLYTTNSTDPGPPITSGETGHSFDIAMRYLGPYAGKQIIDRPPGHQAAGHVEAKAAALMRAADRKFGVLVINNAPCTYASGVGCGVAMTLILPIGSSVVVWWPGGHKTFDGTAANQ